MDGFEQQSQNEISDRLRLAMMAAKMQGMGGEQEPSPMTLPESQQATGNRMSLGDPGMGGQMPASQPNVNLAHASRAEQPASSDVTSAQAALDKFQHPSLMRRVGLPLITGLSSALAARSYNGAQQQAQIGQEINQYAGRRHEQQQSLVQQLQNAQGRQEQEYEADQRNRQQDLITAANNQNRSLMTQIVANSRQGVAQTAADARRDVADTTADSRRDVAKTGADARIQASRYAADQAMSRLIYGQDKTDARQSRAIGAGFQRQEQGYENSLQKPTADEDRRADLAKAAIHYSEVLEDIMQRRPEFFGPLAGRLTNVRNAIGTSDPDLATLKYLKEQLGIVQMGAHSLRSAQAIAPIADSLVNSFHNDASAGLAVLKTARDTLGTFTGEQVRPTVTTPGRTPLPKAPSASKPAAKGSAPIVVTADDLKKATGGH